MVLAAALSRVFFYPLNYSPVIAMALFGGSVIKNKKLAFALPLFSMLLADLLFEFLNIATGFWGWGQLVGYGIFAIITLLGFKLKKINVINVAGFSILSSVIFFFLSNSAFWLIDNRVYHLYSQDFSGYINSLIGGLPFLEKSFFVDLAYCAIFFGGYVLFERQSVKKARVIAG